MAVKKFFSKVEIEEAIEKLNNLPDLSSQRISRGETLDSLKQSILMLAKERGYSTQDIKLQMDAMGFVFSEKDISSLVSSKALGKKRSPRKNSSENVQDKSTS